MCLSQPASQSSQSFSTDHAAAGRQSRSLASNADLTLGQVHMTRQDYSDMQTRKVKALHAHKAVPIKRTLETSEDADVGAGGPEGDEGGETQKTSGKKRRR